MGKLKEHTRKGGSGKNVHAGFYTTCSATLFGRPELWKGMRTVSASSLDNPAQFKSEMDVWLKEALPWVALNKHTEKFEQNP